MYSAGAVFIMQTNADKGYAIIGIFSYARKRCRFYFPVYRNILPLTGPDLLRAQSERLPQPESILQRD